MKGSWRQTAEEKGFSNTWECLNVWRSDLSHHSERGQTQSEADWGQFLFGDLCNAHGDHVHVAHQGLQPYVNVWEYHEQPFPREQDSAHFGIALGVDHDSAVLFTPRTGLSHAGDELEGERTLNMEKVNSPAGSSVAMTGEDKLAKGHMQMGEFKMIGQHMTGGQEESGAPTLGSTERLGHPGPANSGTLHSLSTANRCKMKTPSGEQTVAFLGGGKQGEDDYFILEDDDERANADITTPGHLQDRLLTLRAKALDAIKALPAHCREDQGYGMGETRVWGLEALKHILRMRLALQGSIQLTRPVSQALDMPPNNELLAANLTLVIRNRGNRCYANSVLRLWCWMGAHHDNPAEFWGPSTKLCLQLLQQMTSRTSFEHLRFSQSLPS